MTSRETEEKLRKLASIDPKLAETGWMFYLGAEGSDRALADDFIDVLTYKHATKDYREEIFLEPPPRNLCAGEYELGTVLYPPNRPYSVFGLREDEWIRHTLITGMTGTGKTNLAFHILGELRAKEKPFLVFDWKRNYRDLVQLPEFSALHVFTVGRSPSPFLFNPLLPPPGAEPGHWLMKLVDVINHAYLGGHGVEFLLREGIDQVYRECGTLDGSNHDIPTFRKVKDAVEARPSQGRVGLWKASAMRALESLCFLHGLGPVLETDAHWDYQYILNSDVILELDGLSNNDKVFLVEAIILWIYEYRKNLGKREKFSHALLIEEAHHCLSEKKETNEGAETILETSLRQIREFGEAVIAIDQEPTKLSNSIKANTYMKVTMNLGNGKDVKDIAISMGLNIEETEFIDWLKTGEAVVSLKGRFHVPLHVRFPKMELKKGFVTDKELAELAKHRTFSRSGLLDARSRH